VSGRGGTCPRQIFTLSGEKTMATYTTSNGNTYEFSFERQLDGSIRSYIVQQPSYGSRDTDPDTIHRLKDGDRYYVCWNKLLYTMSDVKEVATEWARHTDRYIKTGQPFKKEAARASTS
jgi:hypothetical protein